MREFPWLEVSILLLTVTILFALGNAGGAVPNPTQMSALRTAVASVPTESPVPTRTSAITRTPIVLLSPPIRPFEGPPDVAHSLPFWNCFDRGTTTCCFLRYVDATFGSVSWTPISCYLRAELWAGR